MLSVPVCQQFATATGDFGYGAGNRTSVGQLSTYEHFGTSIPWQGDVTSASQQNAKPDLAWHTAHAAHF